MNALRIFLTLLTFISISSKASAAEYKGDYLKITGEWTALDNKWCGGWARVACNDGRNCEIQIHKSKCSIAEVYLEQDKDVFKTVVGTYRTHLMQVEKLFNETYSSNIYIDLRRALTAEAGGDHNWKKYWVNIVLSDGNKTYEKICPNFNARF